MLFFTVSIGKQPRYILPVLPPLAVFVARGIVERIGHQRDRLLTAATWITAIVYAVLAFVFVRMEPLFVNAYPLATWIGVCLLGCSAIALAGIAATSSWRVLPIGSSVAGVLVLMSVWFGALAGNRPEPVEQMAALIQSHRSAQEPIGVLDVFTRNLGFYTGAPRMQLFGVEQAGLFLQSPERVLLVLRSADLPAVDRCVRPEPEDARRSSLSQYGEYPIANAAPARPDHGDRDDLVGDEPMTSYGAQASACADTYQGKILPGFRMPFGSNAALTRFISAISSGDSSIGRYARLREADAVLAADRAFERDDPLEQLALGLRRAGALLRVVAVDHQVDVDVAVAGVAERGHSQRVALLADRR